MLRTFSFSSFTPTATADTIALANDTYMAMKGGSATMRWAVEEIYMGGQAGASSVNDMVLAQHSTIAVTPTALSSTPNAADLPVDGSSVGPATALITFTRAATGPQRKAAGYLLALSFNAFGGVVRWNGSNTQIRPVGLGNSAALGEMSLSDKSDTGTAGLISAHIIYEPF